MTRLRLLVPLAVALAALTLAPAASADTCTTITSFGVLGMDGVMADDGCAEAVLVVTPNPADPGAVVTLDGGDSTSGDVANPIESYIWDFGDGDGFETRTSATTHVYARGVYTAQLTIEDADGDELADDLVDVYVSAVPVARLIAPSGTLRPNVSYDFDATGSTAPGGSIDRYEWSWGDGTTTQTAGPTTTHAFGRDGASTEVSVTVVNDLGLESAPATAAVAVLNQVPAVQLVATPATVAVGEALTLDATGSADPDGSIARYDWDLDANGSFEKTTGLVPSVAAGPYPNPGVIQPRVRVVDDSGAGVVRTVSVTVRGAGGGLGPGGGGGSAGGGGDGSGAPPRSGGGSGSGAGSGAGGGSGGGSGSGAGGFSAGLGGTAIQQLRTVLRRGVGLTATANRAARGTLLLTVTARAARTVGLPGRRGRPVTIGAATVSLRAGRTAKPSIKLARGAARALRRKRPRALRVTVSGLLDAGGERAAVARVVLLRG